MILPNVNGYQPGNIVVMNIQFTNNATPPVPADPTTVTLRVIDPRGVETDYSYSSGSGVLTKNSVGNYSYSLEVLLAGLWNYRFEGTGVVIAAAEKMFQVYPSKFSSPQ